MWGFTEQPSTLHDNQLIQRVSGKNNLYTGIDVTLPTLSFCCEGAKISVSIFKWDKILPSPKLNGGAKGDTESSLVYLYLFVGCLNFFLPRGKQKRLQREERGRERLCFSEVVWTWIVSWFPAQSACGFQSPWHAISPLSTSWNSP